MADVCQITIAACDTFRAGAVEQLAQHARKLDVPLFQRGYEKDPASVASAAVASAKAEGRDVVLVDTAGRMQVLCSTVQCSAVQCSVCAACV
jgi:signal recognition particle receptor subunit alpha